MPTPYFTPVDVPAFVKARSDVLDSNFNLIQAGFDSLPTEAQFKLGTTSYAADTGAANAYVVALPHTPASYADGLEVTFKAANTNSGASTINVSALGVKSIVRPDGTALATGDIYAAAFVTVRYNATTGKFLFDASGSGATATAQAVIATTKASEAAASAAAASSSENAAASSAGSASTSASTATTQASSATSSASTATTKAAEAAASAASIAGGPVASVNGLTGVVVLPDVPEILTPTNTSPADAATNQTETPTLTGSTFYSNYGATHAGTQVQVHTSIDFTTPQYSSGDQAGSTSFVLPSGQLVVSTLYYWRIRYKNSRGTYSGWSTATSFTTKASFNDYIATPTATPAAFGDSFEGGFYTGQIWNELVQSASSYAIGTGSKAFVVADMAATPLVYAGQTLEVRSRANPANKMIGVVTGASGTALTINVTSVGGSGTFTDWSIMAQYRVIVAPKATGENTSIAYKNANDAAPAACGTLSEGRKATLAMVAAGTSTVYPAAHWCNNLSIAGKTDWYLPARDELELCWRNLKPTADANYTTADRPAAATPNYANLGSYGDTAATHGLDNNSSPVGAAHISGDPAQVAAGKNFRTSESEAFAYGSFLYWSASEYSAANAWHQYWNSSVPGNQVNGNKANAYYVRAVRRSII